MSLTCYALYLSYPSYLAYLDHAPPPHPPKKVLRLGLDWGRLTPHFPSSFECDEKGYVREWTDTDSKIGHEPVRYRCRAGVQNRKALEHYAEILEMIRGEGMSVMLTLFHHSLPKWANERSFGGWTNDKLVPFFVEFCSDVVERMGTLVESYVILNEPAVYVNLVYGVGMWPGRIRDKPDLTWSYLDLPVYRGAVMTAYANMAQAHNEVYDKIHALDFARQTVEARKKGGRKSKSKKDLPTTRASVQVGVAHNVAYFVGDDPLMKPVAKLLDTILNFNFFDRIAQKLDFIGLNYYGKEVVSTRGAVLKKDLEYSESGRAVFPEGLYHLLRTFHQKYNVEMDRSLPIWVTENGISDETDVLRPSFLIEHLLAIQRGKQCMVRKTPGLIVLAKDEGIPIKGYVFWTISDNWVSSAQHSVEGEKGMFANRCYLCTLLAVSCRVLSCPVLSCPVSCPVVSRVCQRNGRMVSVPSLVCSPWIDMIPS